MAALDFKDVRHQELRDALLQMYAAGLDEMLVKDYLLSKGFEGEVETLLSPHVLIHGAFAKPSASEEEARAGWREIFSRLQSAMGKDDVATAQNNLAEEMSEKAWQRLKMLKQL